MEIHVPTYGRAFWFEWEPGFTIKCKTDSSSVLIEANKEGLISLARHLLELAGDNVPEYTHFHLDEFNSLEKDSTELIIVRRNI